MKLGSGLSLLVPHAPSGMPPKAAEGPYRAIHGRLSDS